MNKSFLRKLGTVVILACMGSNVIVQGTSIQNNRVQENVVGNIRYGIYYELNGGINHPDNLVAYEPMEIEQPIYAPTKEGYDFGGWYLDNKFSQSICAIPANSSTSLTIYAKWCKQYKITYKLNGGKNNKKNPKIYSQAKGIVVLQRPSKKGYYFKGWYWNKKCTKKCKELTPELKADQKLYAKWKKVKVKKAQIKSIQNVKGKKLKIVLSTSKNPNGYEFIFANDKNFRLSRQVLRTKKKTVVYKGFVKNKVYYIKVRSYIVDSSNQKVFSGYSNYKQVRIRR